LGKELARNSGFPVISMKAQQSKRSVGILRIVAPVNTKAFKKKLKDPEWKPDFGPSEFNEHVARSGATAISARDFLIAYNVNLNTTSTRRANAIAFDIREAGRVKREGNPITGKKVLDRNGEPVREPGKLKAVKGIGWYIEEY